MRESRFTEKRKLSIPREYSAGAGVLELSRKYGVSPSTLYTWRSRHDGVGVSELRRLGREERVIEVFVG